MKFIDCLRASIGIAIRTLAMYSREAWSELGIGVAKETIAHGPSIAIPCTPATKNIGASSLNGMANPHCGDDRGGMANVQNQPRRRRSAGLKGYVS